MSALIFSKLETSDPELTRLLKNERLRQCTGLQMIASENCTSVAVLEALATCAHNKYSEGLPGKRYYGGTKYIDLIETLAQKRALEAFDLNPEEWGVNVQPYSGSPANLAVYTALLNPHERIMGMDLPDGGHLSHGFMTPARRISATSIFFESMPYKTNPETELIDYEQLETNVKLFKPKIIIAGVSAYPRLLDYMRFKKIADSQGAYLMADISHIAGLVAAKVIPSPFNYACVVTTTTHKTLRGPRAALIFYRKGFRNYKKNGEAVFYDIENRINLAVFPGLQGGPHNNTIAAIATAMLQVKTSEFTDYQTKVLLNTQCLARGLIKRGYNLVTNGSDVHFVVVNLSKIIRKAGTFSRKADTFSRKAGTFSMTGAQAEHVLELVGITCNKNTIPTDTSALCPSGIRLGTPTLTSRGFVETDMEMVVDLIDRALQLAIDADTSSGSQFYKAFDENVNIMDKLSNLILEVNALALKFPLPCLNEI